MKHDPSLGSASHPGFAGLLSRASGAIDRARGSFAKPAAPTVLGIANRLLELGGEAPRVALAVELIRVWQSLSSSERVEFMVAVSEGFGPEPTRLDCAISAYKNDPGSRTAAYLHAAAEPPRQELLRRLNLAPDGTRELVRMRAELLEQVSKHPSLHALEADLAHLFASWFNPGFLQLQRIDWQTSAGLLDKIIEYEAVHQVRDWDDLRRRLEPPDRRCFAFFHPKMSDEPLIFVEVALTRGIPATIQQVLGSDRTTVAYNTAVFYSISSCQKGLRGISFGDFLIKKVVGELRQEDPGIVRFATLSPMPGFAGWLRHRNTPDQASAEWLSLLGEEYWWRRPEVADALRKPLTRLAAEYLVIARTDKGRPADPVARFHLGNGARVRRINYMADLSERGLREAHGMMVNYEYRPNEIEHNQQQYALSATVPTSVEVRALLR